MTDTPRTLDEILTLLADNTSRAISAQDLRDFAVSAMQRNYEGFGWRNAAANLTLTAHPTNYGTTVVAPFGVNRPGGAETGGGTSYLDPDYELAGSDPASAYGVDVDAGNAIMLPPGKWRVATVARDGTGVAKDSDPIPHFSAYLDQVAFDPDFDGALDGSEPFMYQSFFNPMMVENAQTIVDGDGLIVTYWATYTVVNDTPDPQPFAMYLYTLPGRTTNVALNFYGFTVMRVM